MRIILNCRTIILKVEKRSISIPRMEIMNASILEGAYPNKLKLTRAVPIFESGDDSDPNNYRPISPLFIFKSIFKKRMYKRLKSFFKANDLSYESQYGFREKHSTQRSIIDIVNRIKKNKAKGMFSCGIFIDLTKAFDIVDHASYYYVS